MPTRSIRPSAANGSAGGTLTTQQLCVAASVTRGALRLYEREGLIAAPPRTRSGYRNYPASEVERLTAIQQLKEVGFTLREIALLLGTRDHSGFDAGRLSELAREQLLLIDARIERLARVRRYVAAVAAGDAALINDPECRFLVDFLSAGGAKPTKASAAAVNAAAAAGATAARASAPAGPGAQAGAAR